LAFGHPKIRKVFDQNFAIGHLKLENSIGEDYFVATLQILN